MPSSPSTAKPLLVIIAAVMALTSLVFSSLTWSRVTESIATLGDARQARTAWERLLSMAKDAESGQRGYQITGEEPYLEPLQQARDQIPRLLELQTGMGSMADPGRDLAGVDDYGYVSGAPRRRDETDDIDYGI